MSTKLAPQTEDDAIKIQNLEKKIIQLQMEMARLIHTTEAVRAEAELKMLSSDLVHMAHAVGDTANGEERKKTKNIHGQLFDDQEVAAMFDFASRQISSKIGSLVISAKSRNGIFERRKYREDAILQWLEGAGLFDREYYLATNADVAEKGIDPGKHYVEYGAREGRQPSFLMHTQKSPLRNAGN